MKTGLITSDTYQKHDTGDGHPEKIDRVTAVIDNFKKLDNKNLIWKKPNKFENSFLIKTHTSNYIDQVDKSFPKKGYNFLDGDTVVSPGSKDASKDAVGSILTAIDGVQKKEFKNAFCAVRPPGHHAEKEKAMGFCIFNNVAVGANYLIEKYKYNKIAILSLYNKSKESKPKSLTFLSIKISIIPPLEEMFGEESTVSSKAVKYAFVVSCRVLAVEELLFGSDSEPECDLIMLAERSVFSQALYKCCSSNGASVNLWSEDKD